MTKSHRERWTVPFDMSLRLWSDHVPLDAIVRETGFSLKLSHIRGETITTLRSSRAALRHYAVVASATAEAAGQVDDWLRSVLDRLSAAHDLHRLVDQNKVEAVVWIAMFGEPPRKTLRLHPSLVERSTGLGLRILIENYAAQTDDLPEKTWLPERAPVERALA